MSDDIRERIRKARAELNRLEAKGETVYDAEAQRADKETTHTQKAIARRNKATPSGPSGRHRARALGIPASAVPRCGANTATGEPCKQPAGSGTDHYGSGPCKYHGGAAQSANTTHGRYSGLFKNDIEDMIQHFAADNDPLDLTGDIVLIRSLTEKFIREYDDWLAAILAWHESFAEGKTGPPKPQKVLELTDVYRLLETLSKAVERERKARSENAISARDLFRIINHMGRIIETYVRDEETLKKIREEILKIRYA